MKEQREGGGGTNGTRWEGEGGGGISKKSELKKKKQERVRKRHKQKGAQGRGDGSEGLHEQLQRWQDEMEREALEEREQEKGSGRENRWAYSK
eukprot:646151-Pleurochrysis_carterae.AAC.1